MNLFAGLVVSLPFFAGANTNISLPIIVRDKAAGNSQSACSIDMRPSFPACRDIAGSGHEYRKRWTWATAVGAATAYYSGQSTSQCAENQCAVASWGYTHMFGGSQDCCPNGAATPNPFSTHCDGGIGQMKGTDLDWTAGTPMEEMIQSAMNRFTKKSWQAQGGQLDQATLDAALQGGNPVVLLLHGGTRPLTTVTIHGCDGAGKYWFHSPSQDHSEKTFFEVDYDWLRHVCIVWRKPYETSACQSGSPTYDDEVFRKESSWVNTLFIPGSAAIV